MRQSSIRRQETILWELVLLAGSLDAQSGRRGRRCKEPAFIAKYTFELAQTFNLFYHRHHILSETDPARKLFLFQLSRLAERQLVAALDLAGHHSPGEDVEKNNLDGQND